MSIAPDTKDWTWVLERPCPECGFDPADHPRERFGEEIRANVATWIAVLGQPDATTRPTLAQWSSLEYGAHVRDVHRIFAGRVRLMLDRHDPRFENWDQDQTAVEDRYHEQDPAQVSAEIAEAAEFVAALYDGVADEAWGRRGMRSNGSAFTVETLGRYHLHDLLHHAYHVRAAVAAATRAGYDAAAGADAAASPQADPALTSAVAAFAAALPQSAAVLEIGSGGGRDALLLEAAGLRVRRTDVTPGFVDLLRQAGHRADLLDPLTDDLGGPYDAVWANASLLHVARADLPVVLARLAAATTQDGLLCATFKDGDGEGWSTHGAVRAARHFTYWRAAPLRDVLAASGWVCDDVSRRTAENGTPWLTVWARRA